METVRNSAKGFTLIELMITVAIVAILAALAIPSYNSYTRRSYYSEVVDATSPYKVAVAACFQQSGSLSACNAGSVGIPSGLSNVGHVLSLTVTAGVINVLPVASEGFTGNENYQLTPSVSPNSPNNLTWSASGIAVSEGYAQ